MSNSILVEPKAVDRASPEEFHESLKTSCDPRAALRRSRVIVATGALLTALPIAIDLLHGGARRVFGYLAADAFYYLTVARNFIDFGSTTFDQVHPTNGYHPLWQFLLAAILGACRLVGLGEPSALTTSVLVGAGFLAAAVALLGQALLHARQWVSTWFLLLPLGAYGVLISPSYWDFYGGDLRAQNPMEGPMPLPGTLWSYANGMESPLVLFFFALATWLYVKRPVTEQPRAAATFGAALTLTVLSRLDHALLVAPIVLLALAKTLSGPGARRWQTAASLLGTVALPIVAYLGANRLLVGAALPLSGVHKSSFPHLVDTGASEFALMVAHAEAGGRWLGHFYREAQIIVPAIFAGLLLLGLVRLRVRDDELSLCLARPADRLDEYLAATALGVLTLAAYDWMFVALTHQGHWYLPVSCTFVTLAVLRLRYAGGLDAVRARQPWKAAASASVVTAVLVVHFLALHHQPKYHANYATFYLDEAPRVREAFRGRKPKLLSRDDGIVAFATGFPTMNATGLMLDPEAAEAEKHDDLGALAVRRGYDLLTSFVYTNPGHFKTRTPSSKLEAWVKRKYRHLFKRPAQYRYRIAYRSPRWKFALLEIHRKTEK